MVPKDVSGARAAFERKCNGKLNGTIKTCLEPERRLSGNAMEPQKSTSKNSKLYYGTIKTCLEP